RRSPWARTPSASAGPTSGVSAPSAARAWPRYCAYWTESSRSPCARPARRRWPTSTGACCASAARRSSPPSGSGARGSLVRARRRIPEHARLEAVDGAHVLLRPVPTDALAPLALGPLVERRALASVVVPGHVVAAGGLHEVDVHQEELTGAGLCAEQGFVFLPARVALVDRLGV